MVQNFLKVVRRLQLRQLVVFIPVKNREPYDGVAALRPVITAALGRWFRYWIHVDRPWQNLREVLKSHSIEERPPNVIVFAHPSRDRVGFAVNGQGTPESVLPVGWWSDTAPPNLLFAHVCFGYQVLQGTAWAEQFPRWVSYRADIEAFVGSEKAMQRWARLAEAIIDACASAKTPRRAKERVLRAYLRELDDIEDKYDPANGDDAMLMCLESAKKSLICSEDVEDESRLAS